MNQSKRESVEEESWYPNVKPTKAQVPTKEQKVRLDAVLWRLGLTDEDSENLVELIGVWPNFSIATRLTHFNDIYALQHHEGVHLQNVYMNRYNGLTFELQIREDI